MNNLNFGVVTGYTKAVFYPSASFILLISRDQENKKVAVGYSAKL